jgi:hypothetical protein
MSFGKTNPAAVAVDGRGKRCRADPVVFEEQKTNLPERRLAIHQRWHGPKYVRFHPRVQLQTYVDDKAATEEGRSPSWLCSDDYQKFRRREVAMIRTLSSNFPGVRFSIDGIESFAYRTDKKKRVFKAKMAVLLEQEKYWEGYDAGVDVHEGGFPCDSSTDTFMDLPPEEGIAAVYGASSRRSCILAEERGRKHAEEVALMDDQDGSNFDQSSTRSDGMLS